MLDPASLLQASSAAIQNAELVLARVNDVEQCLSLNKEISDDAVVAKCDALRAQIASFEQKFRQSISETYASHNLGLNEILARTIEEKTQIALLAGQITEDLNSGRNVEQRRLQQLHALLQNERERTTRKLELLADQFAYVEFSANPSLPAQLEAFGYVQTNSFKPQDLAVEEGARSVLQPSVRSICVKSLKPKGNIDVVRGSLTISIKDEKGNGVVWSDDSITTASNTLLASVNLQSAGDYRIDVLLYGHAIQNSPLMVHQGGPPNAGAAQMVTARARSQQHGRFTASNESFSQPATSATIPRQPSVSGQSANAAAVSQSAGGPASRHLASAAAGGQSANAATAATRDRSSYFDPYFPGKAAADGPPLRPGLAEAAAAPTVPVSQNAREISGRGLLGAQQNRHPVDVAYYQAAPSEFLPQAQGFSQHAARTTAPITAMSSLSLRDAEPASSASSLQQRLDDADFVPTPALDETARTGTLAQAGNGRSFSATAAAVQAPHSSAAASTGVGSFLQLKPTAVSSLQEHLDDHDFVPSPGLDLTARTGTLAQASNGRSFSAATAARQAPRLPVTRSGYSSAAASAGVAGLFSQQKPTAVSGLQERFSDDFVPSPGLDLTARTGTLAQASNGRNFSAAAGQTPHPSVARPGYSAAAASAGVGSFTQPKPSATVSGPGVSGGQAALTGSNNNSIKMADPVVRPRQSVASMTSGQGLERQAPDSASNQNIPSPQDRLSEWDLDFGVSANHSDAATSGQASAAVNVEARDDSCCASAARESNSSAQTLVSHPQPIHTARPDVTQYMDQHNPRNGIRARMIGAFGQQGFTNDNECETFRLPIGCTFNEERQQYVICDTSHHVVKIYNVNGDPHLMLRHGLKGNFQRPSAVIYAPDMQSYIIKDDRSIGIFDYDGVPTREFGRGLFRQPFGLARDSRGLVYTIDEISRDNRTFKLYRFDVRQSGEPECFTFEGSGCRFMDLAGDKIVTADYFGDSASITTLEGKLIRQFGVSGRNEGEMSRPSGVAIDGAGNILMGDSRNSRVQVFKPNGDYLCRVQFDTAIKCPSNIHLTSTGQLMIMNYSAHYVSVHQLEHADYSRSANGPR